MDINGYPEDDDIAYLKGQLDDLDFYVGANIIKEYIEATGYGKATIGINPGRLTVATGGWSGCEDVLEEVSRTPWGMMYWESTHRGGLVIYQARK